MSDDFDHFLDAARNDARAHASTGDDARRIESSLGSQVSLRRPVPAAISEALAAASTSVEGKGVGEAAAKTGLAATSSWVKATAFLLPVLGLTLAYSVTTFPSNTSSNTSPNPSSNTSPNTASSTASPPATPSVAEVAPLPAAAPISTIAARAPEGVAANAAPVVLGGPADLPDAKESIVAKDVRAARPGASHGSGAPDSALDAELALLSQVTSALHTNRPARALALVDEHDRRFKDGVLMPEFNAQRVIALASLGRQSEACAESAKFLAKYPKSPFVSQVRSSCADSNSSR